MVTLHVEETKKEEKYKNFWGKDACTEELMPQHWGGIISLRPIKKRKIGSTIYSVIYIFLYIAISSTISLLSQNGSYNVNLSAIDEGHEAVHCPAMAFSFATDQPLRLLWHNSWITTLFISFRRTSLASWQL